MALLAWACAATVLPGYARAQSEVQFARDIQPILSEYCYHCHGPDENTREADVQLDTRDGLFAEASDGKVVVEGDALASELYRRIVSEDEDKIMPPPDSKLALSKLQKDKIKQWIDTGAEWEKLWSLVPPKRPRLPAVKHSDWPVNLIDAFILRKLESKQLSPGAPATREKWLRRVYLDLIGITPTIEEIEAFLDDTSPNAHEKVVDRLLASPLYGEKMAWAWLDAARYADSNGFQGDGDRTMWPWRDWVVDAMNSNLPYDEFTLMQIAGDLLPKANAEDKLATGFCRNHMINGEGGRIPEENRVEYIFDQLETVGTIWMGMTFNCCRCHDHKYDPLLQKDYYSLFAIFNKTPVNGGGGNPATPPNMKTPSRLQKRSLQALEPDLARLRKTVAKFESDVFKRDSGQKASQSQRASDFDNEHKKSIDLPPGSRNARQLAILETTFKDENPKYVSALKQLREVSDRYNAIRSQFPTVMVMADTTERKTFRLDRGLYNKPLDEVQPAAPKILDDKPESVSNRLELANWLTDPQNPLMARVTVNRIWQNFFGTGLVKTTEDFGSQGEKPSHPELLDWLAVEFIESGWDVKALHRKIVLSATYRQSARVNPRALQLDPDNRWLAYSPRYRMPAWMIRDNALYSSGLLNLEQGGPSVRPYQPQGIWAEATFGKKRYVQDKGSKLYRRSLYTFWRRIMGPAMFFDVAKRQNCEVKVSRTNSPLHALVTLNDITFVEAARVLADSVSRETPDEEKQIENAFYRVTSRGIRPEEKAILLKRYRQQLAELSDAKVDELLSAGEVPARSSSRKELAALSMICLTILNLDEALTK